MDVISDENVVAPVAVSVESRQADNVQANFAPSPESNINPPLPMGDVFFPDPFNRSADMSGFRRAMRGFVAFFWNPNQHWAAPEFTSGHLVTGRKPVQQYGGMAPFAERANIPNPQAGSYGEIVQQATYDLGLDPNSGW